MVDDRVARDWGTVMRWVVTTGLVGVAAVGAVAAVTVRPDRNGSGEAAGPRAGAWPVLASADARRAGSMDVELEAVRARIREKEDVAAALVRGELSADRAAARFGRLLEQEPKVRAALRLQYPDATDADLAVHLLINFVERERRTHAGSAAPVLAELRAAVGPGRS
jgi:hypothetical protein